MFPSSEGVVPCPAQFGLGNEFVRGDLKAGRLGSIAPFELLQCAGLMGDADAVLLWREYDQRRPLPPLTTF